MLVFLIPILSIVIVLLLIIFRGKHSRTYYREIEYNNTRYRVFDKPDGTNTIVPLGHVIKPIKQPSEKELLEERLLR